MRVDVDGPRKHEQPGCVDPLGAWAVQVRPDALDQPTGNRNVGADGTAGGHDGAAADDEIGHRSALADLYLLGTFPQHAASHLRELLLAAGQCGEVVPGKLPDSGAEAAGAIREEDLALADVAGVDEEIARRGMRGGVLEAHVGPLVPEGD